MEAASRSTQHNMAKFLYLICCLNFDIFHYIKF